MALTEQQRNPWRAIVAGGDYSLSPQDWEDLLTELDSLYTAPPIDQDLLTIHRILQCVSTCPPVEPGDSKVLHDFKCYCITMNGIAERLRAKPASEQKPVAWYDGNKFYADEAAAICGCADMSKLKPVGYIDAPPATPDKVVVLVEALEELSDHAP